VRRLHPFTGLARAVGHAIQGLGVPIFGYAMLSFVFPDLPIDAVFVLGAVGLALGAGYGAASYLRFEYELGADALVIRSGVLARREREIPYGRVQNVDVQRDLLKRALGAAVVRVETAGGGSTEAVLDFVSTGEAERIQRTVRERRRAERPENGAETEAEETDAGRPEDTGSGEPTPVEALFELSLGELAVYSLSTFRPGALALFVFVAPLLESVLGGAATEFLAGLGVTTSLSALTFERALVSALVVGPMTVLGAYVVSAAYGAIAYYGFRLVREGDDLRYERGLVNRYSGSIPLSKVQTLTVGEPVLMRALGYAGLTVETAGYSPGEGGQQGVTSGPPSAVPAAERAEAIALGRRVEPFGGMDLTVERPPTVARRRYAARYALLAGALVAVSYAAAWALGGGPWYVAFSAFLPVPLAAHLKWANLGYRAGEDALVVRRGFWNRRTSVVPYERIQTVNRERSVFQRRLGLATLVADTASAAALGGGPPAALDIDADDAAALHRRCRERLQERIGARGERSAPTGGDGERAASDRQTEAADSEG
jgi:putative membrane protein